MLNIVSVYAHYITRLKGVEKSRVEIDLQLHTTLSKYDKIYTCGDCARVIYIYDLSGTCIGSIGTDERTDERGNLGNTEDHQCNPGNLENTKEHMIYQFTSIQHIQAIHDELIVFDGHGVYNHPTHPAILVFTLQGTFIHRFQVFFDGLICQPTLIYLTSKGHYFIGCFSAKLAGITYLLYSHSGKYLSQFSPDCGAGNEADLQVFYWNFPIAQLDKNDNVYLMNNQEHCFEVFNLDGTKRGIVGLLNYMGLDNRYFGAVVRLVTFDNWVEILYGDYENQMKVTILSLPLPERKQQVIQSFQIRDVFDFIGVLSTGRFLLRSTRAFSVIVIE